MKGIYLLDTSDTGTYSYNVRNDYTVTLSSALKLNYEVKEGENQVIRDDTLGAIIVRNEGGNPGRLDFGQAAEVGVGYGSLTFDGNYPYPLDGPMLHIGAGSSAVLHSGITLTNHTNYSRTTSGTVYSAGTFEMMDGSTITSGVSPNAGAVYIAENGKFNMSGGALKNNTGAMPRFTEKNTDGSAKADSGTGDLLYPGQPKYYDGAGAVYAAGASGSAAGNFTMSGGTVSDNRGEWGALAGVGGSLALNGGTISGNAALKGNGVETGDAKYDFTINGYTEGDPAESYKPKENEVHAGYGGGVFLREGGTAALGAVTITENWAQQNGGGIAVVSGGSMSFSNTDRTVITYNAAGKTDGQTQSMGGGIFAGSNMWTSRPT